MNKETKQNKQKINTRYLVQVAMLAAAGSVLMMWDFPLWFLPPFYKIDLGEIPVIIGSLAMGPVAGILIAFLKNIIKIITQSSSTAGIGELANFVIGCALIIPPGIMYKIKRSRKNAMIGLVIGILSMSIIGGLFNAFLLLPFYAAAYNMPMSTLIGMGSAVNKWITDLPTFIIFAVVPFNIIKGTIVTIICAFLYKPISPILKIK